MTILKPHEYQMLQKTVHNVRCYDGYAEITFTDGEHCWFEKYTEADLKAYFAEVLEGGIAMEIPGLSELVFDEVKHYYRLEGRYIPSVTTIMRPLTADLYKDIDEAVLKAAAAKGTKVHEYIENYIKYGVTDVSEYQGYYNAFLKWDDDYKPQYFISEYRSYHPLLQYAGTTDTICEIKGKLVTVDFKTTSVLHPHLVKVQLEAYARALQAHGIPIEGAGALQLKQDGNYDFISFAVNNAEYWGVFSALLTVHQYIQKNKIWAKK